MILLRYIFVALILCLAVVGQDPSWSIKTPNFWSQKRRDIGFQRMHLIYPTHTVSASRVVHTLGDGHRLPISIDAGKYMVSQRASGLIIIHEGKIRFESYKLGHSRSGRWASFSVAKSITSTLVGAAIKDGFIRSLEDMVSSYIPGLKGSAYDSVSILQLLTMTSGVKWNEDYLDPQSDAVRLRLHRPERGIDATVSYMRNLPRDLLPGTKWVYKTGETNLVGVLIRQATQKSLSAYLAEKIWIPIVFAPYWLDIVINTPQRPWMSVSPNFGSSPSTTRATSLSRTLNPSLCVSTTSPSCSAVTD